MCNYLDDNNSSYCALRRWVITSINYCIIQDVVVLGKTCYFKTRLSVFANSGKKNLLVAAKKLYSTRLFSPALLPILAVALNWSNQNWDWNRPFFICIDWPCSMAPKIHENCTDWLTTYVGFMAWEIWKARCSAVYKGHKPLHWSCNSKTNRAVADFIGAQKLKMNRVIIFMPQPSATFLHWSPRPPLFIKINVDGCLCKAGN